jgi:hypothetical protein
MGEWPRPCPIPGHPHDDGDAVVITDSVWARLRRWHLHAPAERLPLPAVLLTWPAAWMMHGVHVPARAVACLAAAVAVVTWLTWARRNRRAQARDLFLPTEAAMVAAAWGGWVTAATMFGPMARPDRWPTLIYLAGVAGGYWWLRHHDAVRAARKRRDDLAAEIADKTAWHQHLSRAGLGGWHIQEREKTLIGEKRLITTSPENASAKRTAASSAVIAEKLEHILGLPYGRVDLTTTGEPGQLWIGIRTVDLSVRDAAYHPMTLPWPDKEPSPFASWFPPEASIRDPVIWGFCPEDGTPLTVELISKIGGRAVGVFGMTGSGKSNLLNGIREGVTRCPDARLVQLNGVHMGDELTWEPLSALTVCGPVQTDEGVRDRIGAALSASCLLVTQRSATLAATGHSTFQVSEEHPAVVIIIDEADMISKHVPGARAALEELAGKERKSGVSLVLATQRGTIADIGGGGVRANMKETLVGATARASESRHVTGAETDLPDISEYSGGAPGYFLDWDPGSKTVTGRGRAFLLGVDPDELAYIGRLVAARQHVRDWSIPDLPPLDLDAAQDAAQPTMRTGTDDVATQQISGLRAKLASITQTATQTASAAPATAAATVPLPIPLEIPQAIGQTLLELLAAPEGTTAEAAGLAIGKSKETARKYLKLLQGKGIARLNGAGPAARWYRTVPAASSPKYTTIEDLADAAHNGQAGDLGEEQRAVLEQVHQVTERQRNRPHLALVPPPDEVTERDG